MIATTGRDGRLAQNPDEDEDVPTDFAAYVTNPDGYQLEALISEA